MLARYIGIIVMLIGAILLIVKGLSDSFMPQNNTILIISIALVVIGYILFIFLDKMAERKVEHDTEDESVRIKRINQTDNTISVDAK